METILANHCEQNFVANMKRLQERFESYYKGIIETMDSGKIRRIGMNTIAEMCIRKVLTEFEPEIRIYPNKSIIEKLNKIRGACTIYFDDISEVDAFWLKDYVNKLNDNGMVDVILEQLYDDRSTKSNAWLLSIKNKQLKSLDDIAL